MKKKLKKIAKTLTIIAIITIILQQTNVLNLFADTMELPEEEIETEEILPEAGTDEVDIADEGEEIVTPEEEIIVDEAEEVKQPETEEGIKENDTPEVVAEETESNQVELNLTRNRSGRTVAAVGSWDTLIAAFENRNVDVIYITNSFLVPSSAPTWYYLSRAGSSPNGIARTLTVLGNGHTIDFGDTAICYDNNTYTNSPRGNWDISWQNLKIYSTNIWGFTTFNDLSATNQLNSTMRYHNVTQVGSQLIHSPYGQVFFSGTVESLQAPSYVSGLRGANGQGSFSLEELHRNQTNIHVNNLTIEENAVVNLKAYNAGNIDLTRASAAANPGILRVKKGAKLNIEGSDVESLGITGLDEARGTNIQIRDGGTVSVEANAEINLRPKPTYSALSLLGSGSYLNIEQGGKINIDTNNLRTASTNDANRNLVHMGPGASILVNGEMNLFSKNTSGTAHLIRIGSTGSGGATTERSTLEVNGILNVVATGMGSSAASLVHVGNSTLTGTGAGPNSNGGTFIVHRGGSLGLVSDSTSVNHHLIYFNAGTSANNSSIFAFSDAKYINLQRLAPTPAGGGLIGMNGTLGALMLDIQQVSLWQAGNLRAKEDFSWNPLFAARIQYTGATITSGTDLNNARTTTIRGGFGLTQEESRNFRNYFNTQNAQRISMGFIPDVDVKITDEVIDNVNDSKSYTVRGTATPGSYVRITDNRGVIEKNEHQIKSPVESQGDLYTVPDLIPNPSEYTDNFTLRVPDNGQWEFTLDGKHFIGDSEIRAFAFLYGKYSVATTKVLDRTPPTGDSGVWHGIQGQSAPEANVFVSNVKDTNTSTDKISITYKAGKEAIQKMMENEGEYEVEIVLTDPAGNQSVVKAKLVVHKTEFLFTGDDIVTDLAEVENMSQIELEKFIFTEGNIRLERVIKGELVESTDTLKIYDFDGLQDGIASGDYVVTFRTKDEPKVDRGFQINVKISGTLSFASVPSVISFGNVEISSKKSTYYVDQVDQELSVLDSRSSAKRNNWQVGVSVQTPLTNQEVNHTIEGAFVYMINGEEKMLNSGKTLIYQHYSTNQPSELVHISDDWDKTEGLALKIPAGTARKGAYQGGLNWTLEDVVGNE